jgi:hypothetical protein
VELLLLLLFTYKPQLSYVASVEGKIGRKGRRKYQSLSLKREKKPISSNASSQNTVSSLTYIIIKPTLTSAKGIATTSFSS